VYDFENGHPLLPKNLKYSRYKPGPDGRWVLKNSLHNECWRMWTSCVVTWDGRVVPCCFDKDAKYQLGQLTGNTFAEIWNGEKYRQFRNQILRNRKSIDICRNCSEGSQVWG
jgi:radical SAM protein with 4Fe4S-binding SPASM domain